MEISQHLLTIQQDPPPEGKPLSWPLTLKITDNLLVRYEYCNFSLDIILLFHHTSVGFDQCYSALYLALGFLFANPRPNVCDQIELVLVTSPPIFKHICLNIRHFGNDWHSVNLLRV